MGIKCYLRDGLAVKAAMMSISFALCVAEIVAYIIMFGVGK